MKISQEEINAAYSSLLDNHTGRTDVDDVLLALKAAYTVRRARKQAKHERQRKEKDKQVVESVKPASFAEFCEGGDEIFAGKHYPSKAPEWDGTFGVGEWEMRNGEKQIITYVSSDECTYPVCAYDGTTYTKGGFHMFNEQTGRDLIRPWPKGEQ